MKKKIVIFGGSGMLGYVVAKYFSEYYEVVAPTSDEFNILNTPINEVEKFLTDDVLAVINCAGIVKPRIQFYEKEDVFKINSWFPIQLSKIVQQKYLDFPLIHISTDCVFTGNNGPYMEEALQDSLDIYGMSKAIGESCVKDGIVIRTSIIGEELKNKYSLLEWAISQVGKEVSGWTDHIWSGVTTLELAKFIHTVIKNKWKDTGEIIHYASAPINKYELLKLISKVYDLQLKINKTTSGIPCNRSLVPLSEEFLAPDLELQLNQMREFFNEHR